MQAYCFRFYFLLVTVIIFAGMVHATRALGRVIYCRPVLWMCRRRSEGHYFLKKTEKSNLQKKRAKCRKQSCNPAEDQRKHGRWKGWRRERACENMNNEGGEILENDTRDNPDETANVRERVIATALVCSFACGSCARTVPENHPAAACKVQSQDLNRLTETNENDLTTTWPDLE